MNGEFRMVLGNGPEYPNEPADKILTRFSDIECRHDVVFSIKLKGCW